MSHPSETVRSRLRKYKRREAMTVWVGAGFAGFIAILGLDVVASAPLWIQRIAVTLIILGALALAMARVGFEWKATIIKRHLEDGKVTETDTYPSDSAWPGKEERFWTLALLSIILTGLVCLLAVWWPRAAA